MTHFFWLKTNIWSGIVGHMVGPFKFCLKEDLSSKSWLLSQRAFVQKKKLYCLNGISQICIFSHHPYGCPIVLVKLSLFYILYVYLYSDRLRKRSRTIVSFNPWFANVKEASDCSFKRAWKTFLVDLHRKLFH